MSNRQEAEAVERKSDNARLAARQMIHAASSLPDDNVEGNFKMSFF